VQGDSGGFGCRGVSMEVDGVVHVAGEMRWSRWGNGWSRYLGSHPLIDARCDTVLLHPSAGGKMLSASALSVCIDVMQGVCISSGGRGATVGSCLEQLLVRVIWSRANI